MLERNHLRWISLTCLLTFCLSSASIGATTAPDATQPSQFSELQVIESWGWILAQERDVSQIEINDRELASFVKGVTERGSGSPPPAYLGKSMNDVKQLAKARRAKLVEAIKQENAARADAYIANLRKTARLEQLPEGVWLERLTPGAGPMCKPRQTANVHFVGTLIDGTEFIEFGPIDNVLVDGRAHFKGWLSAMQKISKGAKIRLYVPPPLSDDDAEKWGVPPGSMMVFAVDLLDVRDSTPDELDIALTPPAPAPPPPSPSGFTEAELFERWGWATAGGTGLPFTDEQQAAFVKGLTAGIRGAQPPYDLSTVYPVVKKLAEDRRQTERIAFKKKQLDDAAEFFAKLKTRPNIVSLPDGLCYEILKPGTGSAPRSGQIAYANYTARLLDGREFDKSGDDLADIEVGKFIQGWDEGVQKIGKGGKIRLYIPYTLAFGEENAEGVPAYSTVIYDIDLVDVKDQAPSDSPTTQK